MVTKLRPAFHKLIKFLVNARPLFDDLHAPLKNTVPFNLAIEEFTHRIRRVTGRSGYFRMST